MVFGGMETLVSANEKTNLQEDSITKVVADTTKEVAISKANKDRLHELSYGLDVLDTPTQKEPTK